MEHYILRQQVGDSAARLVVKQAVRRFDEPDRVVFVWRSVMEVIEFAGVSMSGSGPRFFEKGYRVISRASARESLMQTYSVVTPLPSASSRGDISKPSSTQVNAITDFMLPATVAYISNSNRSVESVLARGDWRPATPVRTVKRRA